MTPDEIVDELYGLPLDQFIQTRNGRARELTDAGNREAATSIRKLQKPSPAAWVVNALVRTHPDAIADLVTLGGEFRQAQQRGSGDALRRLASKRRDLLGRLLRLATEETGAKGHQWTTSIERQVAATLEAALADEKVGSAVQQGRLTQSLSHVGFGEAATRVPTRASGPGPQSPGRATVAGRRRTATPPVSERSADGEQALSDAQQSLDDADAVLAEARRRYDRASEERRDAARTLREADKRQKESGVELQVATKTQKVAAEALSVLKRRQGRPRPT